MVMNDCIVVVVDADLSSLIVSLCFKKQLEKKSSDKPKKNSLHGSIHDNDGLREKIGHFRANHYIT